jgi:IMP cyclohydrolase
MLKTLNHENIEKLKTNTYPGRGIIIGLSPNSENYIQVYWIMGRSENSRNRVFLKEHKFVRTEAFDKEKLIDPSLIIYYPIKVYKNVHIVSNGDQTDTIFEALVNKESFETALKRRTFEPDAPNFTPRISGILDLEHPRYDYQLSILKSFGNNQEFCIRNYYNYEKAIPGTGHCIHTYAQDGNPIPSFEGEPFQVPLFDHIDEVATNYWNILNEENKISLLVKFINRKSGDTELRMINKNQR